MEQDLELLNSIYGERQVYQGELHDHANTGGTSDGKRTLEHWKGALEALEMDFATILDHKQVRHMYLPEWDNSIFIGGTEPATRIPDAVCGEKISTHYNMIFSEPKGLERVLEAFPEFEFTGGPEGHFQYRRFTRERFGKLIDAVIENGGFFVIPHPKQVIKSDELEDFWYRDWTALEVFYQSIEYPGVADNYAVWTGLLAQGKHIWASAGCDKHRCARDTALTSIYAEEKDSACFIKHLRKGDFTCGPVGIQMCIGETAMGGMCKFDGQRLVVGVGKFHKSVRNPEHKFRMDILDEQGVVYSQEISCEEPTYYAMNVENRDFYRVEIYDITKNLLIAIGNPIWNEKQ